MIFKCIFSFFIDSVIDFLLILEGLNLLILEGLNLLISEMQFVCHSLVHAAACIWLKALTVLTISSFDKKLALTKSLL